jgi:hypothetical protein
LRQAVLTWGAPRVGFLESFHCFGTVLDFSTSHLLSRLTSAEHIGTAFRSRLKGAENHTHYPRRCQRLKSFSARLDRPRFVKTVTQPFSPLRVTGLTYFQRRFVRCAVTSFSFCARLLRSVP